MAISHDVNRIELLSSANAFESPTTTVTLNLKKIGTKATHHGYPWDGFGHCLQPMTN